MELAPEEEVLAGEALLALGRGLKEDVPGGYSQAAGSPSNWEINTLRPLSTLKKAKRVKPSGEVKCCTVNQTKHKVWRTKPELASYLSRD